jgi:hypothetical protein
MARCIAAAVVTVLLLGGGGRAADEKSNAILDKAIKALGGEEKLSKIKAVTWKTKGTISLMGGDNPITTTATMQGLDHLRQEFEGDFGGNKIQGVTVVAGDKGWRKFGDNTMDLDKEALANQKRAGYLTLTPILILPLKGKDFKAEVIADEKIGDKPAAGLKVTAPDGKDFKIYFDKESGLPVRTVAQVVGFMGEDFTLQTNYSDYKEMGGIKKATKVSAKRDGEKFQDQEITEFKALDKPVDAKTFTQPE